MLGEKGSLEPSDEGPDQGEIHGNGARGKRGKGERGLVFDNGEKGAG